MKFIISVCIGLVALNSLAQNSKRSKSNSEKKHMTTDSFTDKLNSGAELQTDAYFPEGDLELNKIITQRLTYSQSDIEKRATGSVVLNFKVNIDSTITDIKIIKDPCKDCGQQLVQIFRTFKFAPAINNGQPIQSDVVMEIPVMAY